MTTPVKRCNFEVGKYCIKDVIGTIGKLTIGLTVVDVSIGSMLISELDHCRVVT